MTSRLLVTEIGTLAELRRLVASRRVCAIVDACVARDVSALANQDSLATISLYDDTPLENYPFVAPYLVELNERRLVWLLEQFWSDYWGILVFSSSNTQSLAAHFRALLEARDPNGEAWVFRIYDPRVLKRYLPTCTRADLQVAFGSISAIGTVEEDGNVQWTGPVGEVSPSEWLATRQPADKIRVHLRGSGTAARSSVTATAGAEIQIRDEQLRALGSTPCLTWAQVRDSQRFSLGGTWVDPHSIAMLEATEKGIALVDPHCAKRSVMER